MVTIASWGRRAFFQPISFVSGRSKSPSARLGGAGDVGHTEQKCIHPQKLTWNLEMMVSNRNLLFQGSIFRFHVCFGGCNVLGFYTSSGVRIFWIFVSHISHSITVVACVTWHTLIYMDLYTLILTHEAVFKYIDVH